MDDAKSDIMMFFVLKGGNPVYAESALEVDTKDRFMEGFTSASYESYSNFFEVSDFQFKLSLNASENKGGNMKKTKEQQDDEIRAAHLKSVGMAPDKDEYEKWRSADEDEIKKMKYPINFGGFSFKRVFDAASPIFFLNCANNINFDRAVLVKRLQATVGSETTAAAYMRVEFTDVQLTQVTWDDGDVVKENCQCKCKKMLVQYKLQNNDGTLSTVVSQASWDQSVNGTPPGVKNTPGSQ